MSVASEAIPDISVDHTDMRQVNIAEAMNFAPAWEPIAPGMKSPVNVHKELISSEPWYLFVGILNWHHYLYAILIT